MFYLTTLLAQVNNPVIEGGLGSSWDYFNKVLPRFLDAGYLIAAVVFIFIFIIGSFQWITSGSDKGKLSEARGKITHAIVGLLVLLLIFLITKFVNYILGINIGMMGVPEGGNPDSAAECSAHCKNDYGMDYYYCGFQNPTPPDTLPPAYCTNDGTVDCLTDPPRDCFCCTNQYVESSVITSAPPTTAPVVPSVTLVPTTVPIPSLSFDGVSKVVDESSGLVKVPLRLSSSVPEAVSVNFKIVAASTTAITPDDYDPFTTYTVTFAPFTTTANIDVGINLNPLVDQDPRDIVFEITDKPVNANLVSPTQYTLTIRDVHQCPRFASSERSNTGRFITLYIANDAAYPTDTYIDRVKVSWPLHVNQRVVELEWLASSPSESLSTSTIKDVPIQVYPSKQWWTMVPGSSPPPPPAGYPLKIKFLENLSGVATYTINVYFSNGCVEERQTTASTWEPSITPPVISPDPIIPTAIPTQKPTSTPLPTNTPTSTPSPTPTKIPAPYCTDSDGAVDPKTWGFTTSGTYAGDPPVIAYDTCTSTSVLNEKYCNGNLAASGGTGCSIFGNYICQNGECCAPVGINCYADTDCCNPYVCQMGTCVNDTKIILNDGTGNSCYTLCVNRFPTSGGAYDMGTDSYASNNTKYDYDPATGKCVATVLSDADMRYDLDRVYNNWQVKCDGYNATWTRCRCL